ncbi:GPP34 family phosphoprotein [Actinoplanes sp. NPDC051851]|uniref:GOLPH3/VPS74 family protein n=1 Tax=Actinoplanes sp. NPDC051851 TaxID=3154753 RepID=UPI0034179B4C
MASPPQLPPADDLFLVAHDSIRGKSLLTPVTLGLGLGSALLGELMLWRRIDLVETELQVIDERPTGDAATTALLEQIRREAGQHGVRNWIAYLSTGIATDLVERRLARAGLIKRVEKRSLLGGTKVSFVPADSMTAGWPATRIRTKVGRDEQLDVADLLLSGLILATGLDQHVLASLEARDRTRLFEQFRRLFPAMLQQLVAHAEAAVGDAVMARRA